MNSVFNIISLFFIALHVEGLYDRLSGKKTDVVQTEGSARQNVSSACFIDIKPCTPHEGSRVDGTCNSIKDPAKGAARGPYLRLLKPDYANKRDIRMNKLGEQLPSPRKVRTTLQTTGRVANKRTFTAAAAIMLEFVQRDVSLVHGPRDYLVERQHCCSTAGESDPRCIPIRVPKDDPYLKVTGITCLNFSRAETFQDFGCTTEIIPPEQINFQTPLLDLSTIYGVDDASLATVKKGELGLLWLERRGDRYVPLIINKTVENDTNVSNVTKKLNDDNSTKDNVVHNVDSAPRGTVTESMGNITQDRNVCIQNRQNESICYRFGLPEAGNYNLGATTLGIFFMREHNRIATALHKINPCWKDDRVFKVARQINIATAAYIFMYELLPSLLGYRNMVNYGLLSEQVEHVSTYQEQPPLVYAEFEMAMRYFHTMRDGRVKTYAEKHHYTGEFSVSETMFRQALIEQGRNFEEINRGTFYQSAGKIDDNLDPEISEKYFGELQKAHDLGAIDIQRGRDMGIRGYNDYRPMCGMKAVQKFEELIDEMDVEKMEALKSLYKEVDDIDLLAGIVSENFIQGTYVGPTLFCILTKQLQLFRYSDRFWFERGDQVHSFSLGQLQEIRKTSMARLVCDNAEGIKFIQPHSFLTVKPGNSPVPCTHIDRPDLSKWRDDSCSKHKYNHEATHLPMSFIGQGDSLNFTDFFNDLLFYGPDSNGATKKLFEGTVRF